MKHWTTRLGIVLGGMSLFLAGCEQPDTLEVPPGEGSAPLVEEAAEEAPVPAKDERRRCGHSKLRHKGGPGSMLLNKALHDLELTDEQRQTLEGLHAAMKPSEEARTAHKDLRDALAAGVRAGKLDDALIEGKVAALEEHGTAKRDKMLENLNTLHATLTPEQRTQLVEGIRKKVAKWEEKPWFDGDREDREAVEDGPPRRGKMGREGKMTFLLRGLDLAEEQRTQLREAMSSNDKPSREAMKEKLAAKREKMKSTMDAFASADFDAKTLMVDAAESGRMRKMVERKVAMVRALLAIVDDTQREQLAANLEKDWKSNKGKRGKLGKHRKPGMRGKPGMRDKSNGRDHAPVQ